MTLRPHVPMALCLGHGRKEGEDHGNFSPQLGHCGSWNRFLLEVLTSFAHSPRTLILHSHLIFIQK